MYETAVLYSVIAFAEVSRNNRLAIQ